MYHVFKCLQKAIFLSAQVKLRPVYPRNKDKTNQPNKPPRPNSVIASIRPWILNTFPGGSDGKASAYNVGDPGFGKIPWRRKLATHSSILAWRISWTEEPGRLQSTGSQRVGHDWATSLSLSCSNTGFPGGSVVKNLPANAEDSSLVPGSGRSPGGGNGNPFQYTC